MKTQDARLEVPGGARIVAYRGVGMANLKPVAHGRKLDAVMRSAARKGVSDPVVFFVPRRHMVHVL